MTNVTSPFATGPKLSELRGAYPRAQDVLEAAAESSRGRSILARLWISEGIPFAFKDCPSIYEGFRASLAKRLDIDIDSKQIGIAGSGRLGYSLAPSKWGKSYQLGKSDLDWFAVSRELFERLRKDFEQWRTDYENGKVEPKTKKERDYWNWNRDEVSERICKRGFVDSYRVPNYEQYGMFLAINSCLEGLQYKLKEVENAPYLPGKHLLSLRCYRDWPALEKQVGISLSRAVDTIEQRGC